MQHICKFIQICCIGKSDKKKKKKKNSAITKMYQAISCYTPLAFTNIYYIYKQKAKPIKED